MFYVCYVVKDRKYGVFPAIWLKDHKRQLAKYINMGLNSNQALMAYYSEPQLQQIESGSSALDYEPNFHLSMDVIFPAEGCYLVIPKKFFENYDEAKVFAENRRSQPPALYNKRRLNEQPLPNLSSDSDDDEHLTEQVLFASLGQKTPVNARNDSPSDELNSSQPQDEVQATVHGQPNVEENDPLALNASNESVDYALMYTDDSCQSHESINEDVDQSAVENTSFNTNNGSNDEQEVSTTTDIATKDAMLPSREIVEEETSQEIRSASTQMVVFDRNNPDPLHGANLGVNDAPIDSESSVADTRSNVNTIGEQEVNILVSTTTESVTKDAMLTSREIVEGETSQEIRSASTQMVVFDGINHDPLHGANLGANDAPIDSESSVADTRSNVTLNVDTIGEQEVSTTDKTTDTATKDAMLPLSEVGEEQTTQFASENANDDLDDDMAFATQQVSSSENPNIPSTSGSNEEDSEEGLIKGEPALLLAPCSSNIGELTDLLNTVEMVEEVDDELTIYIGKKGFGKPFGITTENLIKRQDDSVSGHMPFTQTKTGRIYLLGEESCGVKFEIPNNVIETFAAWNTGPLKDNAVCDKLMVEALLLIFVTPEEMIQHEVDENVRQFINGFMEVRANGNIGRVLRVNQYIADICAEKKNKVGASAGPGTSADVDNN